MNASDWSTLIYSYVFISGAIGSSLWFIAKKAMQHVIKETMDDLKVIRHEVTPNSGSSLKDAVNRIEVSIAKLEGKFEQHVEEHNS